MKNKWFKNTYHFLTTLVLTFVIMTNVVYAAPENPGSGTPDGTPPVLTGYSLESTSISAPGSIKVMVSATDDVSGVSSAHVSFRCKETGTSLLAYLSSTYWDSDLGENVSYPDGKLYGFLEVNEYIESGEFLLDNIRVHDKAGNTQWYDQDPYGDEKPFPDFVTQRSITITASSSVDTTPPELTGFTIASNKITTPDSIAVAISAVDNSSGIGSAHVSFRCKETGTSILAYLSPTYWDSDLGETVPYPDGKLHGSLEFNKYLASGEFILDNIRVHDKAGNTQWYDRDPYGDEKPFPDFVTQQKITVTESSTVDTTPPTLTDYSIATTKITAPGSIEVSITATDNSSGVTSAHVSFRCKETGKSLLAYLSSTYWDSDLGENVSYPDGKLYGSLEINQYLLAGDFILDNIRVHDAAGNTQWYDHDPYGDEKPFPDFVTQQKISVLNSVPDVTTSVSNSDFVKQLETTADDAYIVADYSGNATLPSNAFDAIAGTDKTLDLVSDGVTWRFNGNDIKNESKPIDLNVVIDTVEDHPSDDSDDIQASLNGKSAIVMQFPENGQLPGQATIQLKVDHVMKEYLGSERNLSVYYFNNQTGKLELVAKDLVIINDTFVEFAITHCSHYVLVCDDTPFPFVDVPNGIWYLNPVKWAVANNITNGIDATHFGPEKACTRGQVVTFLWRAAGSPTPKTNTTTFTDINSKDYFYDAVLWAVENGITTGTSKTKFSPEEDCTRGQIVTFLWRYKGSPATAETNSFKDVPSGQFYSSPVAWAIKNNITNGVSSSRFAPDDNCTRAQIVTFLYRAN